MLLVVDVGNSNTVVGVFEGDELRDSLRLETHRTRTADEYRVILRDLFAMSSIDPIGVNAAIMSSVVPPLIPVFEQACERMFGVTPMQVGPGIRTGMPILYDNPREVGADRIVNAVAAYEQEFSALVVVDFGTATTFDAVSEKGEYLGGAIAPGVAISVDALFRSAAKLPRVEVLRPPAVVGKTTVTSIQSGIFFGYVGLVDEIVNRIRADLAPEAPDSVRCLATGGLATLFASESKTIERVDPMLTLEGLRIIHARN